MASERAAAPSPWGASPRQSSARIVIERVLRDGPISRAAIARGTGLSKQTISDVMRELEEGGWVREEGQVQGAVGRSAVTYAIRADAAAVLGIDLGGTKLHVALADLNGSLLADAVEPTTREGGPGVVAQIGRMGDALVRQARLDPARLRAGAMGSPGIVDPRTGAIGVAPNIPGLDSLDVPAALAARLGVPVAVENDVNLAAMGEHWRGSTRAVRTFAFVALGTGIGMGLFADGRLVRGARGGAGEIATLPVGGDPYDARGRRLGTLETAVGSAAIAARYAGLGGDPRRGVREILDRLAVDEAARVTLDETARALAAAILAVQSVIDAEVVVLGGSIGARPEVKERIEAHLARCMAEPPPLRISALGSLATLHGALGRAIDLAHGLLFGLGSAALEGARPAEAAA